jgi:hypothetical protein
MIEILNFKNKTYPNFQSKGFAAKYSFPFASREFAMVLDMILGV